MEVRRLGNSLYEMATTWNTSSGTKFLQYSEHEDKKKKGESSDHHGRVKEKGKKESHQIIFEDLA